jgi:glutamate/tyrosine decarboxylase-like PLP-dependent enzyme
MAKDDTRKLLEGAAARGIAYLEGLDDRPVFPEETAVAQLKAALDRPLPAGPAAPEEVMAFIDEMGSPATVVNAGGRYFGFVTGGALPASLAANWLAGAWDQNAFGHISSPAAALFEEAALRWLKEALDLPRESEGALVTGATMANSTCLAAARHVLLENFGWNVESQGLFGAPEITVIVGEEAHASLFKVLAMLGLGRDRVVTVPADKQGRLRADLLPEISGPTILCLQAGNVNSGAFDPAREIIPKAQEKGAWVHVDGAFGLWARAAAKLSHLAEGLELAESWATDAHKWLNVPYDCGLALVRDPKALYGAMSIGGAYLLLGGERDAINVTPDSSRRARALEVWAALKSLGRSGLAELIERNVSQAKWLALQLQASGLEILNEVGLNQIVVSFGDDTRTDQAIAALQNAGSCWCGGTTWRGRRALRISISSWATTQEDLDMTLAATLEANKSV